MDGGEEEDHDSHGGHISNTQWMTEAYEEAKPIKEEKLINFFLLPSL